MLLWMKANPSNQQPYVSLRWAVGGVFVLSIASRLIGLVREIMIARSFGAGADLDAIFLGLSLPLTLCLGIGGGIGRAVVPVAASLAPERLGGLLEATRRRLLKYTVPLSMVLIFTSPVWAWLLIPAGSEIPYGYVLIAAVLGSVAIIGGTFAGLCRGIANARSQHVNASFSPLLYNVFIIGSILLLSERIGVLSLLVGIVLAEWGQVIPQAPFLLKMKGRVRRVAPERLAQIRGLLVPSVFLAMAAGLMATIDRIFAAMLPAGSVSSLSYADRLLYLPVTLIGLSLQQPLFTRLSRFAAVSASRPFEMTLELGLRSLLLAGAPVLVVFAGLTEPLIAVLLERGAFTADDTARVAMAVRGYSGAIVFQSMIPLMVSAALAVNKAWRLCALYGVAMVLNAVLDALMIEPLGILGIALATSMISCLVTVAMLRDVAPGLLRRGTIWATLRLSAMLTFWGLLAVVLFRVVFPTPHGFAQNLAILLGGTIVAMVFCGIVLVRPLVEGLRNLHRLTGRAGRYLRIEEVPDVN